MTERNDEVPVDTTLWCVNIKGPDDVLAVASRAEAVDLASKFNAVITQRFEPPTHPDYPLMWATPTQWPHDDASHAENLGDLGEYAWLRDPAPAERKVSSEKVSEERLCEIIAWAKPYGEDARESCNIHEMRDMASELLALRSSVKTVGVKKLEWSDPYPDEKPDDLYVSASQGLVYHVRKADRWNVTVSYWDSGEPRQVGSFDTLEQAKAAAQADYEQRILSAIEDPAAASEVAEEIRVPLHSLQADVGYLFGRVAADGSCAPAMAASVRKRLSQIEAALTAALKGGLY